jgi:hypothetical protein
MYRNDHSNVYECISFLLTVHRFRFSVCNAMQTSECRIQRYDKDRPEMLAKLTSSDAPQPQVPAARACDGDDRATKIVLNSTTEPAQRCASAGSCRGIARSPSAASTFCCRTHHLDRRRVFNPFSARFHP